MNWRRGFLRLWVAASAIWIAVSAFAFSVVGSAKDAIGWGLPPLPAGFHLDNAVAVANLRGFLIFGLGMPVLLFALGLSAAWVLRGFRPYR